MATKKLVLCLLIPLPHLLSASVLPRASQPEGTQSSEPVEVLGNGEEAPGGLPGGEDVVQPVERLLPQIIRLHRRHMKSPQL